MSGSGPDRSRKPPLRSTGRQRLGISPPELDEAAQFRLGDFLARRADQLVGEPVPNAFLLLLARMEAKERGE